MALVIDTGPLVAALDSGDDHHAECSALLTGAEELVIPAAVLPEVDYLMRRIGRPDRIVEILREERLGRYAIAELQPWDHSRVADLLETYADLRVGYVDAAVLAIVERLGESKLATLDRRHFAAMRPQHTESLELLPG